MQIHKTIWQKFSIFCLTLSLTLSGCATNTPTPTLQKQQCQSKVAIDASTLAAPVEIPVVRFGRYTLVEIVPESWQLNLLSQIIVIAIPQEVGGKTTTVADAMWHVLKNSGYTLCADAHKLGVLQTLPLPAAHTQLGPLRVHDALTTLAGSAWEMQVDEKGREVCFISRTAKVELAKSTSKGGV